MTMVYSVLIGFSIAFRRTRQIQKIVINLWLSETLTSHVYYSRTFCIEDIDKQPSKGKS